VTELDRAGGRTPAREPALNVPWPVGALIVALVGAHAARVLTGIDIDPFALVSTDLPEGRFAGLLTYQFVHGSWLHLLMNTAFILAFGAPVARYLGGGWRGGLTYLAFFLLCGVFAAVAYAGMADLLAIGAPGGARWALLGASGAAAGLMGAAARLIQGQGRPGPITGRVVTGMTFGWVAINLVLGLSGMTPGTGGAPVAWEAHIFGYLCGLLAIVPAGWLAGAKSDHANAL
jgi:membrane associated rhomboid family serine protease